MKTTYERIEVWQSRFVEWGPAHPGLNATPLYQACELLSWRAVLNYGSSQNTYTEADANDTYFEHSVVEADIYGNQYDYMKVLLGFGNTITVYARYRITLNAIAWTVNETAISTYDPADPTYQLFTRAEEKIESNATAIVELSNQIVEATDNPFEKARKIQTYIRENLVYSEQEVEHGASWALARGEGDCSEFSDLMIALLRAQGIPARKITGWVFVDQGNEGYVPFYELPPGQSWEYQMYQTNYVTPDYFYNLTGHAWVEFYVPGQGWIASDPTWDQVLNDEYFARIDYLHLANTHGQNFGDVGIHPTMPDNIADSLTEFSLLPVIPLRANHLHTFTYVLEVTVEGANLAPRTGLPRSLTGLIVVLAVILVVALILYVAFKKKE